MKTYFLLSLALLAGCGKYDLGNDGDFETTLSITPNEITVGSSEYNRIKEICDALAVKDITLTSLSGQQFNFSQTRKNCDDTSFTPMADANTVLVNQGGMKFTEGGSSTLAYFSEPETPSTGLIKEACSRLNDLESPIRIDSVNLLYVTTDNISANDCPNVSNERCIKFQKAVLQTTDKGQVGKVHTREYIRVRTAQDKTLVGFFSYRKLTSVGGCLEGKYFGRTATLK